MNPPTRSGSLWMRLAWLVLILATLAACGGARPPQPAKDPVAAEIERWSAFLQSETASRGIGPQVKKEVEPELAHAAEDLRQGRRLFALARFTALQAKLASTKYMSERPAAAHRQMAGFEAEWARMGGVLRRDLDPHWAAALDDLQPAAVRALAEAALPQVLLYYQASLVYGRNTSPADGFYYLASAEGQQAVVEFLRTVSSPSDRRAPALRPLGPELDALEAEMLAAYKPPVSVDRHSEFIIASSTLKEARELDAAGLRCGALLRYLQTELRFAPLRGAMPALDATAISQRLRELEARLAAGNVDHSIGRLLLESAQSKLADAGQGPVPPAVAVLVSDVLPRYFAALAPVRPQPSRPAPKVTVTLVRWPYT